MAQKIVYETLLKGIKISQKADSVTFDSETFTEDQRELLISWVQEKTPIRITLIPTQTTFEDLTKKEE